MTRLQWRDIGLVKSGRTILDNLTISVAAGELIGLVGPNGAGKSSLLRLAVGLERPSSGEIHLDGVRASELSPRQRAQKLAFLPQQAEAAWPISVTEAVALGRLPHGDRDQGAIAAAIADVGMTDHAGSLLNRLSGGERALALLGRALAVRAGLLLLDEPTASLDPAHQLQVMEVLRRRALAGDAVVVVMHDLALAARCCDRLLVLHEGRLAAEGSGAAILDDPLLRDVFRITVQRGQVEGRAVFLPKTWVA